jgi:hypothetical protein
MLSKAAKNPMVRGAAVGMMANNILSGGGAGGRKENFDNWFPGQGNNGAMY